ncbi:MAG: hypothetical protein EA384_13010 [Spirochaetaceae bacterium]|nr:MAG: hypothetical protein EA384_13010 [Spirochaetaceae bacterium]
MELEQYGVWVKAGPEDVADESEEMFALSDVGDDIDQDAFAEPSDLTSEEEDLLAKLEDEEPSDDLSLDDFSLDDLELEDMSIPGDEPAPVDDLSEEFDLGDAPEELPELDIAVGSGDDADDLDDIDASAPGISSIESELASIKAELNALRRELTELRGSGAAATPLPSAAQGSSSEEPQVTAGFFEEDEDETIALTDDELDNILNTAEFTEELGQPSEVDEVEIPEELDEGDASSVAARITLEELDDQEMIDLSDGDDNGELETEDPTLHHSDILALSSRDEEITLEDEEATPADSGELTDNVFAATDGDVDALAEMDIDSELAGIEELHDDEEYEQPAVDGATDSRTAADELASLADEIDSLGVDVVAAADDENGDDTTLELEPEDTPGSELELEELDEDLEEQEPEELDLDLDDIDEDDAHFDLSDEAELKPSYHDESHGRVDDLDLEIDLDGEPQQPPSTGSPTSHALPGDLREEIRSVLQYMDQLLESLPEEKIEEFARSEHFEVYKRLFEELGLDSPDAD